MEMPSEDKLGEEREPDLEISEDFVFNDSENMIQFKIVYWGPSKSGKTTNFFRLREKFELLNIIQIFRYLDTLIFSKKLKDFIL